MTAHVVIRDFCKRYGSLEAARSVNLQIERGEIFGLLGPNGAGKTTTLECLVGLRAPDAGELLIGGYNIVTQARQAKQRLGVAPQQPALPDKITPREALRLFGAFYRQPVPPAVLLRRFDLVDKADAPFDSLSGGQRQGLSLALAFVNDPELVVLDEPGAALDPRSRSVIHAEIARMKTEGRTVLLSTHQLEEAERLCDRIAILDHGRVVAQGAPRDLLAAADPRHTVRLVTSAPLTLVTLADLAGVEDLQGEANTARFRTATPNATLAALAARLSQNGLEIVELQVGGTSLEDAFLRLTREDKGAS